MSGNAADNHHEALDRLHMITTMFSFIDGHPGFTREEGEEVIELSNRLGDLYQKVGSREPPSELPCPFCGKADFFVDVSPEDQAFRVVCRGCEAQGPPRYSAQYSAEDAITAWGTRS